MAKKNRHEIKQTVQELIDNIASEQNSAQARFAPSFRTPDWFTSKMESAIRAYAPEGDEKPISEQEFKYKLLEMIRDLRNIQEKFFRGSAEWLSHKFGRTVSQMDKQFGDRWTKQIETVRQHGLGPNFDLDQAGALYRGTFALYEEMQADQARINASREAKRQARIEAEQAAAKARKEAERKAEEEKRERELRTRRQEQAGDMRQRLGLPPTNVSHQNA